MMVTVPLIVATTAGVKVTLIVQDFPALSDVPQVLLLIPKLLLAETLMLVSLVVPVFCNVKLCGGLVVFCCWLANVI